MYSDFWPRLNNCFLKKCGCISIEMISHFLRKQLFSLDQKSGSLQHLYKEMIPHFLRKQYFHIKCVLFRQCNQYGINSISVIDASLWIHLQESEFSAYNKMRIHSYIRRYPHSLRKQLFSLADTAYLIFYRVNCIGHVESLLGSFIAKLPKNMIHV